MTPQDFIASVAGGAQDFQRKSDVYASVTIAQAALETGWGAFIPVDYQTGKKSYNLFGVKGFGTNGHVTASTWEVENGQRVTILADFRAYNSFSESIADHAEVLLNDRYVPVRNAATAEEAADQLHICGYATDPEYGSKLNSIISQYNLKQYDVPKTAPFVPFFTEEEVNILRDRWIARDYDFASDADKVVRHNLMNKIRKAAGLPTT